jgi:hypothetical protein
MIQPMKFRIIISDSVQFFVDNAKQIAALCLPWLLAAALMGYIIIAVGQNSQDAATLFLEAWTFNLLIYPVYTGALILLMAKRAQREQPVNRELTAAAVKFWQPLFVVHLLCSGVTALGFMLLVVPGVYLAVRLAFAEYFLVLEGARPIEAIQKSFQATRPYFVILLILLALFMTPLVLLTLILDQVLQMLNTGPILNILLSTLLAFLGLFVDVLKFRVYMSARQEYPN